MRSNTIVGCIAAVALAVMAVTGVGRAAAAPTTTTKVLVVMEENHSYAQALAGMPNLAGYAQQYGYASAYKAIRHPSLPNYLAVFGGSTFAVVNDKPPTINPVPGASVFDQAINAGKTAKSYEESMKGNCRQTSNPNYVVRHNPWAFFTDAQPRSYCNAFDVPAGNTGSGALHDDIVNGTLPNVGLLTPDLTHDAHDGSLGSADVWLKAWLDELTTGPDFTSGRLAIVITFDEDDKASANKVLTVVIANSLDGTHKVVTTALTHYSLTGLLDDVAGLPYTRSATPGMAAAFGLVTP